MSTKRQSLRRSLWRIPVLFAVVLVIVPATLEGAVRLALFSEAFAAPRLRNAGLFGDYRTDQDYWKLKRLFLPEEARAATPNRDELLGWRTPAFTEELVHVDEPGIAGRRPVLLYGDSFAACATPREDCFQGLFEEDELAAEYGILNYGVGGYGLDQACLLVKSSLGRFLGRRPVVVVSVYYGDDLNRCGLAFRHWPKPRYELVSGELTLHDLPTTDAEEWLEENPPAIRSYLWRWYLYGSTLPPWNLRKELRESRRRELVDEIRSLCEEIVLSTAAYLREQAEDVDYFFLLLPGRPDLEYAGGGAPDTGLLHWQEELLEEVLSTNSIPHVNARREFTEALETGRSIEELFRPGDGHYNREGNVQALRALVRGLREFVTTE